MTDVKNLQIAGMPDFSLKAEFSLVDFTKKDMHLFWSFKIDRYVETL